MRVAIIDMGTNTFHLILGEKVDNKALVSFRESRFVFLGKGGIQNNQITPEALERALSCLTDYAAILHQEKVQAIEVYATSALRSADNKKMVVEAIAAKTGLAVSVIDGIREAELICKGVLATTPIPHDKVCVMDIGGGSVEFIILQGKEILWSQSFEIGGQRLVSLFLQSDPISDESVKALHRFVEKNLEPLWQAIKTYKPNVIVGASGTFRSLQDMEAERTGSASDSLSYSQFNYWLTKLRELPDSQRREIPALKPERSEMIVVVLELLDSVLKKFKDRTIYISTGALKEGAMVEKLEVDALEYLVSKGS